MRTLTIDTSTNILGVAILDEMELIGQKVTRVNQDHSSRLMPAIVELMKDVNVEPVELEKIIVAKGPGSYTGIRIGVTVAKSLAWALDIPVVGVSSLESLAYQAKVRNGLVCSFFDARRENVFAGVYRVTNGIITTEKADANIAFADLEKYLLSLNEEVVLLSPDIKKFTDLMTEELKDIMIIPKLPDHITNPSNLAVIGLQQKNEDSHELIPEYLRMAEAEVNWLKTKENESNNYD